MNSSETHSIDIPGDYHGLRGTLNARQIAMLIIAAAAPLAAVIITAPIAFMFGNGAGLAGTFIVAGLLVLCFAIGYSELIRAIPGGGAFYRYLSVVFGPRVGTGAAWVALASYVSLSTALATSCGYFTDLAMQLVGVDWGWKVWAVIFIVVVAILGRRNADIAAKVLVPLVLAEFGILLLLAIAIVYHKGLSAFPVQAIAPTHIFTKGFGVSLMIALDAFIGIESAALYAQEAKDPEHAIPLATMIAVVLAAFVYFAVVWVIVGDLGWENVEALASKAQGDLLLGSFRTNTGVTLTAIVSAMLCTSSFACYLSLHNAATRYVHTLSSEGKVHRALSVAHASHGSPARASMAVTIIVAMLIALPTMFGVDPYVTILPSSVAIATIGIIALQAGVALATIAHFRRAMDIRIWRTLIFPIIGAVGFLFATWIIAQNYGILTGSKSMLVNSTPVLLLFLFGYGAIFGRPKF